MIKKEIYKNWEIKYSICKQGFNMYNVTAVIYKNKGFREEEYFMHLIPTLTNKIKNARKEIYTYIDNLKEIPFRSNGLINAEYLPSIKEH